MKKLLLSLIVAFAMTATAQNKIELTSLGKYRQFKSEVTKARAKAAPGSKEKTVGVLVEMNQGNTVGQLEGKVSHIAFDRGTLGKVYVTLSQLDRLNSLAEVKRIAFEQKLQKRLDKAAPAMKTDLVHQGADGLPQQFTGKDVIVVVYDDGFDPNHPMFLDADGKSRVLEVITKKDKKDKDFVIVEGDEIANFTTDTEEETHGTHVAGIAAGKYTDGNIHLEGSASGADIIFICSDMVDDSEMADLVGAAQESWQTSGGEHLARLQQWNAQRQEHLLQTFRRCGRERQHNLLHSCGQRGRGSNSTAKRTPEQRRRDEVNSGSGSIRRLEHI